MTHRNSVTGKETLTTQELNGMSLRVNSCFDIQCSERSISNFSKVKRKLERVTKKKKSINNMS